MELKPGYKQTEVGMIPEGWEVSTISNTMELINGRAFKPSEWSRLGLPIIRIQNLNNEDSDFNYYPGDVDERNKVSRGDLLFAWSGTLGSSFGARVWTGSEGVLNQHIFKVIPDQRKITHEYAHVVFRGIEEEIAKKAHGFKSSFVHVKKSDLDATWLPIPPIDEQQAIATALSDVNDLLQGLEQLIAKKRDLKQAAMQQLLTGKQRLPGFTGEWGSFNMARHAILKARIGWQALTTKEYLSDGEYYLVTGTDFINGRVNWNSCHFVDEWRYSQDQNIKLGNGDILLTKDGTIGKVGYVEKLNGYATLNSGIFVIRPLQGSFHPMFLFYVLSSIIFDEFLRKITAGSTITHLYQKDFVSFEFRIPAIDEQRTIATILSDMDAEITALEQQRDKTRELKQGMMQQLLTGQIRLV